MFDEDEEELELLRQYEDKDLAEDDENKSSDDMDSDLEDKIMSMVQYGSGISKKKASAPVVPPTETPDAIPAEQSNVQASVVYAPVDGDNEGSQKTAVSSANIYQIDETDSEDDTPAKTVYSDDDEDEEKKEEEAEEEEGDVGVPELTADVPTTTPVVEPQVTRFINMDEEEKRYMDDEDTSEEEAELESKLQQLIDDQIYNRQSKKRFVEKNIRVCFNCHRPGHERIDCKLCMDCGGLKHKEARCVGARYCSRCKFRGHNAIDCPNPKTYENCRLCGASYHHSDVCPSILHAFTGEATSKSTPTPWCYSCHERGHYGDDCPDLPQYKMTLPTCFSKKSVGLGSRFDPKKSKKSSSSSSAASSSYHGSSYTPNKHQRWSDSSRESSPRYDHRDNRKRSRYNYNDSDDDYTSSKYTRRDTPSKNNNSSKKRQKNNNQGLDGFFSHHQQQQASSSSSSSRNNNNNKPNNTSRSGNNNWKAMNNNSLPQPTRSGTVKVNSYSRQQQQQQQRQDYGDFPRGNNNNNNNLPRPSASGVIDLTGEDNNSKRNNNNNNSSRGGGGNEYSSNRRPKYHGGYSRNR